jgi:xylan 1,4-beta-xylosidase
MQTSEILGIVLCIAGLLLAANVSQSSGKSGARSTPTTYCNPLNLDYAFIPPGHKSATPPHRSTADPAIVLFRDTLYLFSTNQEGYWWSDDMSGWHFVHKNFRVNSSGDDVCAPGALALGDGILFLPCIGEKDSMPIYRSDEPKTGLWTEIADPFPIACWDPAFLKDDDGRIYLYWGSSNLYPIRGVELDPTNHYLPKGEPVDLLKLDPEHHGWERFGEGNTDSVTHPYIEGAWMTKHGGRYYLQYAAPGTEWNIYADGVYVGDHPLGPFTYQKHNPFSYKPGGFITGAGHGSTFQDRFGNWWHVATMLNWIKDKFERRIGLFPAGFDDDGVLYTNTAFGDYPHLLPRAHRNHRESQFTGWVLLSYKKPARASSSLPGKLPELAFDENIRRYWSAATADPGEWLEVDLLHLCRVHAIQLNYADEQVSLYGKHQEIYHQYRILGSPDGKQWTVLVDKSANTTDVPDDYVELSTPIRTRYLRLENVHMAAGLFAVAGFRVFGKADGMPPSVVRGFTVEREAGDRRKARISWDPSPGAYAYNIQVGVDPKKLYSNILVNGTTSYDMRGLDVGSNYFFRIEAVGEGGLSGTSPVVQMP